MRKPPWNVVRTPSVTMIVANNDHVVATMSSFVSRIDADEASTLVVAAVNACNEINPGDPQAVADHLVEVMADIERFFREYQNADKRLANLALCRASLDKMRTKQNRGKQPPRLEAGSLDP